jgi:hypothetical protein
MKKAIVFALAAMILATPVLAEEAKPRNPFHTGQVVLVTPSLSGETGHLAPGTLAFVEWVSGDVIYVVFQDGARLTAHWLWFADQGPRPTQTTYGVPRSKPEVGDVVYTSKEMEAYLYVRAGQPVVVESVHGDMLHVRFQTGETRSSNWLWYVSEPE